MPGGALVAGVLATLRQVNILQDQVGPVQVGLIDVGAVGCPGHGCIPSPWSRTSWSRPHLPARIGCGCLWEGRGEKQVSSERLSTAALEIRYYHL